jgi:hypothetical protein
MKTSNLFLIFALIATIVCTIGCKKETVTAAVVEDAKTLLTSGKWKLTGQSSSGQDSFGTLDACTKDNLETYTTDGKFVIDEGSTKCDSDDPQTQTLSYILSADNKTLKLKDGDDVLDFKILELSKTTLKTESLDLNTIFTYTKQ